MDSAISVATSKVVDAGLISLFQGLFDKLTPPFLQSLGFLFGVEGEADKLKSAFRRIQGLLKDAEDRQIREESVRRWLIDLKDAAYDAEGIVDEVEYQVLRSKIEGDQMQTRKWKLTDQVSDLFSSSVSNLNMGPRIKEIRERLEEIESRSNNLNLNLIYKSEMLIPGKRHPTSSIMDEPIVFGRETDREKVVGLLTSDDDSSAASSGIQVIPICGMGGLGKTTLAQLAYNDERVVKHFVVKAWVYVAQGFDLMRLTKAIAESVVPGSNPHLTNLDAIQVSIKEALKEKRFLLVLDDVWTEDFDDWLKLRAPLMFGARGSRILVTTRSRRVSSNMRTVPTHFLQGLSDDDCLSLFKRRAFLEGDSDAHPDLVKIGKEIVNKCKGLPLAVKTLGGLLRYKREVVDWKSILESEIWDLPEEGNDILPALRLSYHHLPAHLKRCFEFCSIIPKGYDSAFGEEIVWSWMALGFIQSEGSKDMEDIGDEYLADLVSRSLLYKQGSYVRMHDLIHDLARSVLGAEILEVGDRKSQQNAEKVRHMAHVSYELPWFSVESFNFEYLYCFKSLRTLILQGYGSESVLTIPPDLFVNLRHICILDLHRNHITELPESIGNLIQLRYLDLSDTMIERLPKSIGRLYNLQTLRLDFCSKLVEVPSDFRNLVNLRKIFSFQCSASIPFGGLKSLQYLEDIKVGREIGYRVNELRDMNCLRRACISELENVNSVEEAKEAELKNKQKIRYLELKWTWNSHGVDSRQEGIEEEVLNALHPHTNLEELNIRGYCGVRFPTWLGDSTFSKLVKISLSGCKCRILPPFGQLPSLQSLYLGYLHGLEKVGREFFGDGMVKGFPSLKRLDILHLPDLEEWTALEGDMIHVRVIWIQHCSKLRVLPDIFPLTLDNLLIHNCPLLTPLGDEVLPATLHDLKFSHCGNLNRLPTGLKNLTSLANLVLESCPKIHFLPEELPTSTLARLIIRNCPLVTEKCKGGGEYWSKISHIPNVIIDRW